MYLDGRKNMRVIKVKADKYDLMWKNKAENADVVKIRSSKDFTFVGLGTAAGLWVKWPMPDEFTEEELKLYVEMFGDIPDMIVVKRRK